jgi:hypothetical protein
MISNIYVTGVKITKKQSALVVFRIMPSKSHSLKDPEPGIRCQVTRLYLTDLVYAIIDSYVLDFTWYQRLLLAERAVEN